MSNEPAVFADVKVGDTIVLRGSNERREGGPRKVTVTKVGPKRIAYTEYGRDVYVRRSDGQIDDWHWAQPLAAYQADVVRAEMLAEVRDRGWEPRMGRWPSLEELRAVLNALRQIGAAREDTDR